MVGESVAHARHRPSGHHQAVPDCHQKNDPGNDEDREHRCVGPPRRRPTRVLILVTSQADLPCFGPARMADGSSAGRGQASAASRACDGGDTVSGLGGRERSALRLVINVCSMTATAGDRSDPVDRARDRAQQRHRRCVHRGVAGGSDGDRRQRRADHRQPRVRRGSDPTQRDVALTAVRRLDPRPRGSALRKTQRSPRAPRHQEPPFGLRLGLEIRQAHVLALPPADRCGSDTRVRCRDLITNRRTSALTPDPTPLPCKCRHPDGA